MRRLQALGTMHTAGFYYLPTTFERETGHAAWGGRVIHRQPKCVRAFTRNRAQRFVLSLGSGAREFVLSLGGVRAFTSESPCNHPTRHAIRVGKVLLKY